MEQLNDSKGHFEWDFVETNPKKSIGPCPLLRVESDSCQSHVVQMLVGCISNQNKFSGLGVWESFLADHFPRVNLSNWIYTIIIIYI